MAITQVFEYERPGSLGKALKILRKYGDGARVLAGGTDLITLIEEDLVSPEIVVDLKGKGIELGLQVTTSMINAAIEAAVQKLKAEE